MKHTQATHVQTWTLCVRSFFSFWAMMLTRSAIAQTPCCHDPEFIEGSPQPVSGAYFASDVGINGDGNLAILGEIFGDDSPLGAGTARICSQVSGARSEIQTIQHPLPAANDGFGASVDMSGNFAVIAAPMPGAHSAARPLQLSSLAGALQSIFPVWMSSAWRPGFAGVSYLRPSGASLIGT